MSDIRIGIVGCGGIAAVLAPVMNSLSDRGIKIGACASRSLEKASEFALKFSIPKAYGSYAELYADPDVDLVYVATPHSNHKQVCLDAIGAGKAVLCEKAFTVNAKEAEEVFAAAKAKGVYCAEAIWTRYMPSREIINGIISSGERGTVTTISGNLGYRILHKDRIALPELAGGALMDLGVYPVNFALMAMEGVPLVSAHATAVLTEKGVDARNTIVLRFEGGAQAVLYTDAETVSDRRGVINMTNGRIEIENVNNPEEIRVYSGDRPSVLLETIPVTHEFNGYEHELLSAADCIRNGLAEDPHMPHSETLRVLRLFDSFRALWGVKLAGELEG